MSNVSIQLDENELAYDRADLKAPALKTNQTYNWQILKVEPKASQAGNKMVLLTLAAVTSSGVVLKQYPHRVNVLVPTNAFKEKSPKAYPIVVDKYIRTVQSFAAPQFNAFSKVEKTETGSVNYDKDGNVVTGKAASTLREAAKAAVMDARNAFLAGEIVTVGQTAFAPLLPPKDGSEYPEIGGFSQSANSEKFPLADELSEMVTR